MLYCRRTTAPPRRRHAGPRRPAHATGSAGSRARLGARTRYCCWGRYERRLRTCAAAVRLARRDLCALRRTAWPLLPAARATVPPATATGIRANARATSCLRASCTGSTIACGSRARCANPSSSASACTTADGVLASVRIYI